MTAYNAPLTRIYRDWLNANNVRMYRSFFEYNGLSFEVKSFGCKFYAINLSTNATYPSFPTKIEAIYKTCQIVTV